MAQGSRNILDTQPHWSLPSHSLGSCRRGKASFHPPKRLTLWLSRRNAPRNKGFVKVLSHLRRQGHIATRTCTRFLSAIVGSPTTPFLPLIRRTLDNTQQARVLSG